MNEIIRLKEEIKAEENEDNFFNSRVTVVSDVYYQTSEGDPKQFTQRYAEILEEDQQVYERHLTISNSATLDFGWIDNPGSILISNTDALNSQLNYSEQDKENHKRRSVSLCIKRGETLVPVLLINPGQSIGPITLPNRNDRPTYYLFPNNDEIKIKVKLIVFPH
tara:strand:+ start:9049 stop:9543 length:495 start_codon:yes stop_codon:yes gene_type:complete